jgi:hypothetical protein
MPDKLITLTVEGKQAVCNFGINYFYKHYKELTGTDLLVNGLDGITTVKLFEIIPALYCAAYLSECSKHRKDPEIKLDDFAHHILSLDEAGAAKMLTDYTNLLSPPKEGEE